MFSSYLLGFAADAMLFRILITIHMPIANFQVKVNPKQMERIFTATAVIKKLNASKIRNAIITYFILLLL